MTCTSCKSPSLSYFLHWSNITTTTSHYYFLLVLVFSARASSLCSTPLFSLCLLLAVVVCKMLLDDFVRTNFIRLSQCTL